MPDFVPGLLLFLAVPAILAIGAWQDGWWKR